MGPSRYRSRGWRCSAVAVALLACLWTLLAFGVAPAYAAAPQDGPQQLSAAPQDAREVEDFGMYYRIGDNYYKKDTGELALQLWTDGCVYHIGFIQRAEGLPGGFSYDNAGIIGLYEKYYTDGYLLYDCGSHYNMEHYKSGYHMRFLIGPSYPSDSSLEESFFAAPWPRDPAAFGMQNLWKHYSHIATVVSDGDNDYAPDVFIREGLIRVIRFEDRLFRSREDLLAQPGARDCASLWDGFHPLYADHWFDGLYNLGRIENLERLDMSRTKTMAYMFKGCTSLHELDMSGWDTSACIDFTGMFEGCAALEKLSFGTGWTQAGANAEAPVVAVLGEDYAGYQVDKATFPVDMLDESGTLHRAGTVIPDGAGVYTTYRTDIAQKGTLRLLRPGSLVVDAAAKAAYDAAPQTLPAGVEPNEVYAFEDVMADEEKATVTCEYTGGKVVPAAVVEVDGVRLLEGRDFTVDAVCDRDSWEGRATAIVVGIGDYCGTFVVPFTIADTTVHAFLYDDGLLYIKAGRDYPSPYAIGSVSYSGMKDLAWFNAFTYRAGASVPWDEYRTMIKRVMFDMSFFDCAPESMEGWFDGCTELYEVKGWENVNAASVTSMANMFRGCTALQTLDLSVLGSSREGSMALEASTANAVDMAGFLDGCTGLKTLTTGTGWSVAAAKRAGKAPRMPAACYSMSPTEKPFKAGAVIPSGAAEYRFGDIAMQFVTRVVMDTDTFTCTGAPIEPDFEVVMGDVTLVAGRDYVVGYSDNLYPGNAQAVILGKGLFSGGLIVPFKIEAQVTQVGDRLTYRTKSATYVLTVTAVQKKKGKVVGVTTEISSITVMSASTKTITLPNECTIGGLNVTVTAVGSKLAGKFRNVTCVIVGPKVVTIGARAFARAPKVVKLKVRSTRLKSVRNCLAGSNVSRVTTDCKLSNARRLTYRKWFMKQSGKKGVTFVYMIPK